MKSIGLIFLALCAVQCDVQFGKTFGAETRILGGKDAEMGQFPYQASLRVLHDERHSCGAVIIGKRFLLTAAHCTRGLFLWPRFTYVVVGGNHLNDGIPLKLDKITPHEHFDLNTLYNDISLLRTAEEIVFTDLIQPVSLPTQTTDGNTSVVLSGWGRTRYENGTPPLSDTLQFVESTTISFDECTERFKDHEALQYLNENDICTINEVDAGACSGDSGDPLVDVSSPEKKTLVGIISWGIPCGKGYPDVYSSVHAFLDWIERNMAEQSKE
ncbi:chymotrypsin-2-like [Contarinia nasturtii]|uniref:chymotrypsin-2-like n=1 Tax=Contarinia nasturtii TaxID=265458 RepID=UPI0012D3F435|nr:chymotrypsin-2-like [Contarinia nasturtii]